jgi:hypothetical protein
MHFKKISVLVEVKFPGDTELKEKNVLPITVVIIKYHAE